MHQTARYLVLALVLALGGCITVDRRTILQAQPGDLDPASTTTVSPDGTMTCWPATTVIRQCLRRL